MTDAARPFQTSEGEDRGHDPRPLTRDAERPAPMATSSQPHYHQPHHTNGMATHDQQVRQATWWEALGVLRYIISVAVVAIGSVAVALWKSDLVNHPALSSDLAAAVSAQALVNQRFEAEVSAIKSRDASYDRVTEKMAEAIGEIRRDVAFIRGRILTFQEPAPVTYYIPAPPSHSKAASRAGWSATQQR